MPERGIWVVKGGPTESPAVLALTTRLVFLKTSAFCARHVFGLNFPKVLLLR